MRWRSPFRPAPMRRGRPAPPRSVGYVDSLQLLCLPIAGRMTGTGPNVPRHAGHPQPYRRYRRPRYTPRADLSGNGQPRYGRKREHVLNWCDGRHRDAAAPRTRRGRQSRHHLRRSALDLARNIAEATRWASATIGSAGERSERGRYSGASVATGDAAGRAKRQEMSAATRSMRRRAAGQYSRDAHRAGGGRPRRLRHGRRQQRAPRAGTGRRYRPSRLPDPARRRTAPPSRRPRPAGRAGIRRRWRRVAQSHNAGR